MEIKGLHLLVEFAWWVCFEFWTLTKCQIMTFQTNKELGGENFPSEGAEVAFTKLNKGFLKWNVFTPF